MADEALFGLLRQTADPAVVTALETSVEKDPRWALNRINALAFADEHKLDADAAIGAFVRATQLGLFDMSWSALCPGCGGVLETGAALKSLDRANIFCSLCVESCEPTLDELVEVTFTVNPACAASPRTIPTRCRCAEYARQMFWSSAIDLPARFRNAIERITLDVIEFERGEKASMSLSVPAGNALVFEPVTHTTIFLDVAGEETHERRNLSLVISDEHSHSGVVKLQPGPVRISVENRSDRRGLPGVWLLNARCTRVRRAVGRSSPRAACSATRRSARSIATARSIPSSGSRSPT